MRNIVKSLVVASLVGSSGAYAYPEGFYIGLSGGLSKLKNVKSTEMPILYKLNTVIRTPALGDDVDTLKFKRGIKLSGSIGYRFLDFRTEIEMNSAKFKYDGFYLKGKPILSNSATSGKALLNSLFLNGYYDWNTNSILTPYVGFGLGSLQVKNRIVQNEYGYIGNVYTYTHDVKAKVKNSSVAYQTILGASLELFEGSYLTADYRFLKSLKKITAFDNKISNHSINLGVRYHF
jgi:opacity protein-like surface antigen